VILSDDIVEQRIIIARTGELNPDMVLVIADGIARYRIVTAITIDVYTKAQVVADGITEQCVILRGDVKENASIGVVTDGIPREGVVARCVDHESIVAIIGDGVV
jgi:hypothetical protein